MEKGVVMRHFLNSIVVGIVIFGGSHIFAMDSGIEYTPQDLSLVNAIKRQSNLTQSDVDKYKLLFLGGFASLTALSVPAYAAYKAGVKAYTVANNNPFIIRQAFTSTWMPTSAQDYMPSGSMQEWMTSRVLWSGIAAGGAFKLIFPVLYSRTKEGIFEKIKNFEKVCSALSVAKNSYKSLDELQRNIPSSWSGKTEVAQYLALENLFQQGGCAIDLLGQVEHWGINVAQWEKKIADFNMNLMANKNLLQINFDRLIKARWDQQGGQLKIQDARAKVAGQHIKNITTMWKTLQGAAEFGIKHKGAIGSTVAGAYLYSKYQGLFGK